MALRRSAVGIVLVGFCGVALAAAVRSTDAPQAPAPYTDARLPVASRVSDLLARMTLDEKVGQMTQADSSSLKAPEDVSKYFLGSVLSGGDSEIADVSAAGWAKYVADLQRQALSTRLAIPILYGIDAVHGHNNVRDAVVFPHNIGLGCTRDAKIVEAAARVTAEEVLATGMHWTFAPCVAVPQDERWGRTYEGFAESASLVAELGAAAVRGFQGDDLARPGSVLATAKHYLGDGGTENGVDQGDTKVDEATLRRVHLPGYVAAVKAGVGTVMASFSSWNGEKVHGQKYLLTTLLKGELGFKGFVVSDWKAIEQLPGDYAQQIEKSIDAGVDMVMVPDVYPAFFDTLKQVVASGRLPMSRIDDAVRRILTVKFRMGLFERPFGDPSLMKSFGSPAHRAIARQAVRESLVLLTNRNDVLPLAPATTPVAVAGAAADDVGTQCGGWTIGWQGAPGPITKGTSILQAVRNAAPGAQVSYSAGGDVPAGVRAAIVVIGEKPYAEGRGDRTSLDLDASDVALVKKVKAAGVPTIVVLLSGRPLILEPILGDADAILAAWLPGTEGDGVADVLFGVFNPTGRLSHTWPQSTAQIPINVGPNGEPPAATPLFPYGYGLSYRKVTSTPR